MSAGDLSDDARRYVDAVAAGTGLNRTVVVAWVGSETAWGQTKVNHNYLNVGPGRAYGSTDQAAGAVISLINTSGYYAGIRGAIPAGPVAQVKAIQDSPWDAGHYGGHRLMDVYTQLAGGGGSSSSGVVLTSAAGDAAKALADFTFPGLREISGLFGNVANDAVASAIGTAVQAVAPIGLAMVFTLAALGLIALGLARLTGTSPAQHLQDLQGLVGSGKSAAGIAELAVV